MKDTRYAIRFLLRAPLFTSAVTLTLALTIAANTTLFSVVNAVMLRPLPFREPEAVIQVAEKNDRLNLPIFTASVLNFLSWREQTKTFHELAAVGFGTYTISEGGEPEQMAGNRISPGLFRVLGLEPIAGRAFTEAEERPEAAPVAMIGEGLWNRRFGRDASLVGRAVRINGLPTTIVGIAPASLSLFSQAELYTPLTLDPSKEIRLAHLIQVFGRLERGVTLQQAQSEMDAIAVRVGHQYPEVRDWGIHLITLYDSVVSAQLQTSLIVLLCAVGLVLLIACANIANLLLARAAARQKEMAVRAALGAGRGRLMRQLLVESLVLSVAGGSAGLLATFWAVHLINGSLPQGLLPVPDVRVDGMVLGFALVITVLTGLVFGVAPAWRSSRVNLHDDLKQSGRGTEGEPRARLRHTLATCEIALATILLIGAGLLIRSLSNLQRVHPGFAPSRLLTFQLAPPTQKYPLRDKAPLFYRELLESLRSVPGVKAAAVCSGIPFGAGNQSRHPMGATGPSILPPDTLVPIDWRSTSPGYFQTMGIPLLRGRDFTDTDTGSVPVMIVSQATARKFWGDEDPIGRMLHRSADPNTSFTVVGVVGDVRSLTLDQEFPSLYYPMASRVWPLMDVVVRGQGSTEALLPSIRQKVRDIDPELALANVRTMDQWMANSASQLRLSTEILGGFAAAALLIAAIGIYAVLAYSVTQRTQEIGVRMALGAQPAGILRLVVGEGLRVALTGIGIGLLGGLALGRAVSNLVYGVTVRDPWTYAAVAASLMLTALVACALPARRAARVDPMVALRCE